MTRTSNNRTIRPWRLVCVLQQVILVIAMLGTGVHAWTTTTTTTTTTVSMRRLPSVLQSSTMANPPSSSSNDQSKAKRDNKAMAFLRQRGIVGSSNPAFLANLAHMPGLDEGMACKSAAPLVQAQHKKTTAAPYNNHHNNNNDHHDNDDDDQPITDRVAP